MEGMDGTLPEFPIHLKLMEKAKKKKRVSGSCDTYFLQRERHRLRKERVDRNSLFLRHVNYHDHDF